MTERPQKDYTIERFEAADIDPAHFDHEAHIYVGWLYLRAYPRREAIARFDAALRRLTRAIGSAQKYNAAITWLFLMLIAERCKGDEDWTSFRARNADLFDEWPQAAA